MNNQKYIFIGILIFVAGFFLDQILIAYAYVLILIGTGITLYGTINWLRTRENRIRLREALIPKRGFSEMFIDLFDIKWSKISIVWTFCALGFMLIIHLGAFLMKASGAYKTAIIAIKGDKNILEKTGGIVGFGYTVTGSASTNGDSKFRIGIVGKKNSFYVEAIVFGEDGEYEIDELNIKEN